MLDINIYTSILYSIYINRVVYCIVIYIPIDSFILLDMYAFMYMYMLAV